MARTPSRQTRPRRESPQGFTLLELLIVVTIVGIIAAVAIPSLLQSRRAANEASAISMLRSGVTVNELYRNRFGTYADDPVRWVQYKLLPSHNGNITGASAYDFVYVSGGVTYTVTASPKNPGVNADRFFFVDQTGVIRFSTGGVAGATDPPID